MIAQFADYLEVIQATDTLLRFWNNCLIVVVPHTIWVCTICQGVCSIHIHTYIHIRVTMQTHMKSQRRRRSNFVAQQTRLVPLWRSKYILQCNAYPRPDRPWEQLREKEHERERERERLYAYECGSFKIAVLPNNLLSLERASLISALSPVHLVNESSTRQN